MPTRPWIVCFVLATANLAHAGDEPPEAPPHDPVALQKFLIAKNEESSAARAAVSYSFSMDKCRGEFKGSAADDQFWDLFTDDPTPFQTSTKPARAAPIEVRLLEAKDFFIWWEVDSPLGASFEEHSSGSRTTDDGLDRVLHSVEPYHRYGFGDARHSLRQLLEASHETFVRVLAPPILDADNSRYELDVCFINSAGKEQKARAFWIDADAGYLVVKQVSYFPSEQIEREIEIEPKLADNHKNWVPSKVISTQFRADGQIDSAWSATLSDFVVDPDFSAEQFTMTALRMPDGTRVSCRSVDGQTQTQYASRSQLISEREARDRGLLKSSETDTHIAHPATTPTSTPVFQPAVNTPATREIPADDRDALQAKMANFRHFLLIAASIGFGVVLFLALLILLIRSLTRRPRKGDKRRT